MSRPPKPKSLIEKVCEACDAVGPVAKRGRNAKYRFQKASDVYAAFRHELFKRKVLMLRNEHTPEYVPIPTNGGGALIECRLGVDFILTDGKDQTEPCRHHGVGRDVEEKALYKAQTGANKYYLKGLGLIADDDADNPEYDGSDHQDATGETLDEVAPMRSPSRKREQPIRDFEVAAIENACADTDKAPAEIAEVMCTRFKADTVAGLKRYQFKEALAWASNGAGTLAPKPQAAPALQGTLPLPKLVPSFEMRVGGKTEVIQPKTGSYSV
jgi:hypothetical protein